MSNNPFKLEFTLKQHTPLIHFQHDQEGATIRATELKPKLDKFIVEHVFNNDFDLVKKYLVGYPSDDTSAKGTTKVKELKSRFLDDNFRALDYKVCNIAGELKDGNNGKGLTQVIGNETNWIWFKSIKIEIAFYSMELKSVIQKNISDFFIITRFGKRQSKGYGQFSVLTNKDENISLDSITKVLLKYYGELHFKKASSPLRHVIFEEIERLNRWLKSGINKPYDKAPIFKFMLERNRPIRWEKRLIKRAISLQDMFSGNSLAFTNEPINLSQGSGMPYEYENDFEDFDQKASFNPLYDDKTEYRFVRALLGLAEHYEFLVKENKDRKFVVSVRSKKNTNGEEIIERFQSPITFRFFEDSIFVTAEKIPDEMFEQEFYFDLRMKERATYDDQVVENLLSEVGFGDYIKTPKKIEFSLERFLNKYLTIEGFTKL